MPRATRNKKMLKESLIAYQSRMKDIQKLPNASEGQGTSQRLTSSKGKGKAKQQQVPFPFAPSDRILCIGEGNFSFADSLCMHPKLHGINPCNIYATTLDTEEICYQKYPEAQMIVGRLIERGVKVLFGIDGTKLEKTAVFRNQSWDRVVWNFPHAGKGIADQDRNIRANQALLLGFLRSVAPLLRRGCSPVPQVKRNSKRRANEEGGSDNVSDSPSDKDDLKTRGSILITLRNVRPYTEWELPRLAKNPPATHPQNPRYAILRSFAFPRREWESLGYNHRMTKGFVEGAGTGAERAKSSGRENGEDRCWELYLSAT